MNTFSPLVRARGLTKKFEQQTAVDNIDFEIWPNEVVGFLGPNGAGKTTIIRMMLNLLNPTTGELILFNQTFADHRTEILQRMNSSSGTTTLPGKLSVLQILSVFGDLYGLAKPRKRIDELVEKFDLKNLKKRPLYTLSTGQQIRVALAKAFLNQPKLLLLDEPTASLDPDVADRVRSYLKDVVKTEETTVFLTSHNMREVERVCTRVLFLNQGKIQAEGSPEELARRVKRWKVFIRAKEALQKIPTLPQPEDCEILITGEEIQAEMDKDDVGPFLTELIKNGVSVQSISIHEPTLEDFFVHITRNHVKEKV